MEMVAIQKELQNSLVSCQIQLKNEKSLLHKNRQNLKIVTENCKFHEMHCNSLNIQLEDMQVC